MTLSRWQRFKLKAKERIATLFHIHEQPTFMCPVEGCMHTAHYGRDIWNHLHKEHYTTVRVVEEYDL